jgi:multiple sugar transport system substrate-binding protein
MIAVILLTMVSVYPSVAKVTLKGAKLRVIAWDCASGHKMQDVFKEMGEKYGFKVETDLPPWMSYIEKTMLAVESRKSDYDMIVTNGEWVLPAYVGGDKVFPLDRFVERDGYSLEEFTPWTVAYAYYPKTEGYKPKTLLWEWQQGRLMAIPAQICMTPLCYRKDWFEEAGIVAPPKTWDQFLTIAQKLTQDTNGDGEIDRWGYAIPGTPEGGQLSDDWMVFIHSWGADIIDEEFKPAFNNEVGIEATQFWVDLYRKYQVVPPGSPSYTQGMVFDAYNTGKIGIMRNWYNMIPAIEDPSVSVAAGKTGYAMMPVKERIAARATILAYTIPKNAPDPELSWEFIKLVSSPEVQKKLLPEVPATRADIAVWSKVEYRETALPAVVESTIRKDIALKPLIPNILEVDEAFARPLSLALIGELSVKEALVKGAEKVREVMREAGFYD